jgi:outer membrane protein OmpA-like peptidoglycan-associated protein
MACKKCDPHEICEECPEWIFTLADLIMCMMGLFVLLWVLKESGAKASSPAAAQVQQEQFLRAVEQGFQGYLPTDMTDRTPLKKLNGPGAQGEARERPESPDGTEERSSIIRPGREVAPGGRLLFAKADARTSDKLKGQLDSVANIIRGHRQIVQIKGHASRDDLGPDAAAADTMALSLKRAQVVADYLIAKGVDPEVVRVQGCGTYEPVRQNDSSPSAQAYNRRVEVFVTDTLVDQFQGVRADRPASPQTLAATH